MKYLFVLCIVVLLHCLYISNGFIWLDHHDIEEKNAIIPLNHISYAFGDRFGDTGFYRPLVTISESTDAALYGSWAGGYHLTNILLHGAVVALAPLFVSLFVVLSSPEIIMLMVLIGIHPLTWLPVGAISYRPEILLTFFTFATIWFHVQARMKDNPWCACGAVVCFLLALFSKETALFLVPALLILWEWQYRSSGKKAWWEFVAAEGMVTLLYAFLRMRAVPDVWRVSDLHVSVSDAIGTRVLLVGKLLLHFFNPFLPPISDAVSIVSITHPMVLVVIGCGIIFFFVMKQTRSKLFLMAFFLFCILLAPAFGIIPMPRFGSPHYGYVALVGFGLLVVLTLRSLKKKSQFVRRFAYGVVAIWLTIMSFIMVVSGSRMNNDRTFFLPEVQRDLHFSEGFLYLGNYYLLHNDLHHAEQAYRSSMLHYPGIIAYHETDFALANLAVLKIKQGNFQEADRLFAAAGREASPQTQQTILYNRAVLATQQKDYKKVVTLLYTTKLVMQNPKAAVLLANAFHYLGREREAVSVVTTVLPFCDATQRLILEQLIRSLKKS